MTPHTGAAAWTVGGAFLGAAGGLSIGLDQWWTGWLIWLAYFGVVKAVALSNARTGDTLSEHVWAWFGTQRRKPGEPVRDRTGWTPLRRVLLSFLAWLSIHFLTGGWA